MSKLMDAPQTRWMRTEAAAAYVGLSDSTLEKLRVSGGGPRFTKSGSRIVLYAIEDLNSWLESRRRSSTSDVGLRDFAREDIRPSRI